MLPCVPTSPFSSCRNYICCTSSGISPGRSGCTTRSVLILIRRFDGGFGCHAAFTCGSHRDIAIEWVPARMFRSSRLSPLVRGGPRFLGRLEKPSPQNAHERSGMIMKRFSGSLHGSEAKSRCSFTVGVTMGFDGCAGSVDLGSYLPARSAETCSEPHPFQPVRLIGAKNLRSRTVHRGTRNAHCEQSPYSQLSRRFLQLTIPCW